MSKPKDDRWIGSAQTFIDIAGYTRAVLIYERPGTYILIGPIGCVGDNMDMKERTGKTERSMKRLIEKELREAGY